MINDKMLQTAIAYHEAGHAVVAYIKLLDVEEISILPCDCGLGSCVVDTSMFICRNSSRLREASSDVIAYYMAGKSAQKKYLEGVGADNIELIVEKSSFYDERRVDEINDTIRCNGDEPINQSDLYCEVCTLIDGANIWEAIQKIADKLVIEQKLEGKELSEYLNGLNLDVP